MSIPNPIAIPHAPLQPNGTPYVQNQGPAANGSAPPGPPGPAHATQTRTELKRAFTERQINMIAFSGVVGTGIYLNTGTIIREAGPGGALLGYLLGGLIYWSAIATLGEMTAVLPVEGILIEFPSRFLGRHIGFAVGWLYWACYAVVAPSQIVKVAHAMEFTYSRNIRWTFAHALDGEDTKIPRIVFILLFWALLLPINLIPVKLYGRMEAVVGYFKLMVICGLIILMIIIADGRATPGERKGFSASWQSPNGPFLDYYRPDGREYFGSLAQFLQILKVLSKALFSYVGMEIVAVAVGEAKDGNQARSPESIKVGTRKIYMRVILLYLASIVAVSFPVRSQDPELIRSANRHDGVEKTDSAISPFIIAIVEAGIPTLPHVLNAFFVFSGFASAVNSLYVSSRTLHSLAKRDMVWPKAFQQKLIMTSRVESFHGVPATAVGTGWIVALLCVLGAKDRSNEVFEKFSTNAVVSAQIVNCCICLAYMRYYRHLGTLERQITDPNLLRATNRLYAYKSHFQPPRALFGFIGCIIVILTNGLPAMMKKPVDKGGVVASYISIVIFAILAISYAINRRGSQRATKIKYLEMQYRQHGGNRRGDFPLNSSMGFRESIRALASWIWVYI